MDDKKLLFIYNPRAGKGQIRNNLLDIIDTFVKAGYVVTARPTQYAGEAVELAEELPLLPHAANTLTLSASARTTDAIFFMFMTKILSLEIMII